MSDKGIEYNSPYAPLSPDGPLPPGLNEKTAVAAYRAVHSRLRPKRVLLTLGIRRFRQPASSALRATLDRPEARVGRKESGNDKQRPAFWDALYIYLRENAAEHLYRRVIKPAEKEEPGRVFLDPTEFAKRVNSEYLQVGDIPGDIPPGSDHEALALFGLAFALLQEDDSHLILDPILRLGPAFHSFFGVGQDIPSGRVEPSAGPRPPHPNSGSSSDGNLGESWSISVQDSERPAQPSEHSQRRAKFDREVASLREARLQRAGLGAAEQFERPAFETALSAEIAAQGRLDDLIASHKQELHEIVQAIESAARQASGPLKIQVPVDEEPSAVADWLDRESSQFIELERLLAAVRNKVQALTELGSRFTLPPVEGLQPRTVSEVKSAVSQLIETIDTRLHTVRNQIDRAGDVRRSLEACARPLPAVALEGMAAENIRAVLATVPLGDPVATALGGLWVRLLAEQERWSIDGVPVESVGVLSQCLNSMDPEDDGYRDFLCYLAVRDLQGLLECGDDRVARHILLGTFRESIARNDPLFFRNVWSFEGQWERDRLVSSRVRELFRELSRIYWRGRQIRFVIETILRDDTGAPSADDPGSRVLAERRRHTIREIVSRIRHVGMTGNFRRVRQAAVDLYFKRVAEALEESDIRDLHAQLADLETRHRRGELEAEVVRRLAGTHELNKTHIESLRRFIDANIAAAREWLAENGTEGRSTDDDAHDDMMSRATQAIQRLCTDLQSTGIRTQGIGTVEWLDAETGQLLADVRAGTWPESSVAFLGDLPPLDDFFARTEETETIGRRTVVQWPEWLSPTPDCQRCWISRRSGVLLWKDLLQDGISTLWLQTKQAPHVTLKAFVEVGEYEAAAEAEHMSWCDGQEARTVAARARVLADKKRRCENRMQTLEGRLARIREGATEGEAATDIQTLETRLLEALETNFGPEELDGAATALDAIEARLSELEAQDRMVAEAERGKHRELSDWLGLAGEEVRKGTSVVELQRRAGELRRNATARRTHLDALAELMYPEVPAELREAARRLRDEEDRPNRWPTEERSEWVALLVGNLADVVKPWWPLLRQLDAADPVHGRIQEAAAHLASRLPEEFAGALSGGDGKCPILESLAGDARTLHPLSIVEKFSRQQAGFGVEGSRQSFGGRAGGGGKEGEGEEEEEERERAAEGEERSSIRDSGDYLTVAETIRSSRTPAGTGKSVQSAHVAFEEERYPAASGVAASAWKWAERNAPEQAAPLAAIYAWSTTRSSRDVEAKERALALVLTYSQELMTRSRSAVPRIVSWLLDAIDAKAVPREVETPERLARTLVELESQEPGEAEREAFRRVVARTANKKWLSVLWDCVRGLRDEATKARSALLVVTYRFGESEALEVLLDRADHQHRKYLTAFVALARRAELDRAPKLRAAVQQTIGNLKTLRERPFQNFIARVTATLPFSRPTVDVAVMEMLESVPEAAAYRLVITVTPDEGDPPLTLRIRVPSQNETSDFEAVDAEFGEKGRVTTDILLDQLEVEFLLRAKRRPAAYVVVEVTGETTSGQQIAETKRYPVSTSDNRAYEKLVTDELLDIYEGYDGRPVTGAAFVGRQAELEALETAFRRENPGIVIVYGARRLGKTSLLQECRRRVCATYNRNRRTLCLAVAVDEINLTVGKKPLLEKVLRAICGQTLRHSQNDGVRKLLGASRRQLAECGQFEEGDDSFLANLRTYLGRLKEYAQGRIDRVVLVFDEFDKLLEEYRGRREEVEELTNQLRHAGTEDEDIGILLAGSELMRQLVGHPRNALYGSATQVVLKCFDSVQDRNLAREIVAPQRLMGRRVFARRIVETIAEHTGGHPLFMRIVGCVCSHIAKRRQVSHGIVMDGISRLVNNDVLKGYLPDPVNVIKQQLQALRLLDREDAIRAELLLLRLAQRTTLDQPRVVWGALRHDDKLLTVAPAEAWVRARDGTREAELIVVDGAYLRFRHGLLGEVLRSDAEWGFERLSVELGDLRSRRGDAGAG